MQYAVGDLLQFNRDSEFWYDNNVYVVLAYHKSQPNLYLLSTPDKSLIAVQGKFLKPTFQARLEVARAFQQEFATLILAFQQSEELYDYKIW